MECSAHCILRATVCVLPYPHVVHDIDGAALKTYTHHGASEESQQPPQN